MPFVDMQQAHDAWHRRTEMEKARQVISDIASFDEETTEWFIHELSKDNPGELERCRQIVYEIQGR